VEKEGQPEPRAFSGGRSPIRLPSIPHARDLDRIAGVGEHDPVVLSTQAVQRRVRSMQPLDVTLLGPHEAGESLEDLEGGVCTQNSDAA
jgi:hypothetical protein